MVTERIALTCSVVLLCMGCALPRCEVAPEYRGTAFQNVGRVHSPRLVIITIEHRVFGLNSYFRAKRIRPGIVRGLTANKVFVEADDTNRDKAGQLLVVVKEHLDPKHFAQAYVNGAVSGWSLGLVSTETEGFYDMDITYIPPNGSALEWTGHHPYSMTSGIKAWSKSENTVPTLKVPSELSEGMAARFAQEFWTQNAGNEYAVAVKPATNQSSQSMAIERTTANNIAPEVAAPVGIVQPATAVTPTPTILR